MTPFDDLGTHRDAVAKGRPPVADLTLVKGNAWRGLGEARLASTTRRPAPRTYVRVFSAAPDAPGGPGPAI